MITTMRKAWRIHRAIQKTIAEALDLQSVEHPSDIKKRIAEANETIKACYEYLKTQPPSIRFFLSLIALGMQAKQRKLHDWALIALLASLLTIKIAYDYGHFHF